MRMKRSISSLSMMLFLLSGLYSSAYGFRNIGESSLFNPSYAGRFSDALVNPAALSLTEGDDVFYISALLSEDWDLDLLSSGEKLSGLQNYKSELTFSFFSKHLALTASSGTYFADRRKDGGDLLYDIYNTLSMQIDWSYAFPYVSLGVRIKGGNALLREDKVITGPLSALEHAYFSRFESTSGQDYFALGASIRGEYSFFSASFMIEEILSLESDSDTASLHIGWDNVLDSMSFSTSLRYPEFTNRGNLNVFRPRLSFFWKGNPADKIEFAVNADFQLQLLPSLDFHITLGYLEKEHRIFNFNVANGILNTALSLESDMFSISLMMNVDTGSFRHFMPAVLFSFKR